MLMIYVILAAVFKEMETWTICQNAGCLHKWRGSCHKTEICWSRVFRAETTLKKVHINSIWIWVRKSEHDGWKTTQTSASSSNCIGQRGLCTTNWVCKVKSTSDYNFTLSLAPTCSWMLFFLKKLCNLLLETEFISVTFFFFVHI